MDTIAAQLIIAVIPKDLVDRAMAAATSSGATGATHWKGHGTGVEHETFLEAVFRFQPEREIVTVVAPTEIAEAVFDAITAVAPVNTPGIGFVVSLELDKVAGIRNVLVA